MAKPSSKRLEKLRESLETKRGELVSSIESELGQQLSADISSKLHEGFDDGDRASLELEEDINLELLQMKHQNLRRIEEALRRVADGSYGVCEECGDEIATRRLEALPFATLCVDCQQEREDEQTGRRERVPFFPAARGGGDLAGGGEEE